MEEEECTNCDVHKLCKLCDSRDVGIDLGIEYCGDVFRTGSERRVLL